MIQVKNPNPIVTRLPLEYQEVEYIESTGTQYIDTDFTPTITNNTKIVSRHSYTSPADGQMLAGFDYGKGFLFGYLGGSGHYFINYVTGGVYSNVIAVAGQVYDLEQTYTNGSQTLIVDGNTIVTSTKSFSNTPYPLYLFARNMSSGPGLLSSLKVYYLKLYDNDTLVRDYIPCYRKSDNVAGLYDLVNNTFYTNSGTGAFLVGSDINVVKEFLEVNPSYVKESVLTRLPEEYQEVEYIESTGTQFINTNVIAVDSNIDIDIKFNNTDFGTDYQAIFGGKHTYGENGFEYLNYAKGSGVFGRATEQYFTKISSFMDVDVTLITNGTTMTISDGTNTQTVTNTSVLTNGTALIYLFGNYIVSGPQVIDPSTSKLYYCKLYHNGIIQRDFVPCYRKSDNVIGLYDLVNDVFYTNVGTGTFLKGADVESSTSGFVRKNLIKRIVVDDTGVERIIYDNSLEQLVNYTMLYDAGDECTSLTGGWNKTIEHKISGTGTLTKNADNIDIYVYGYTILIGVGNEIAIDVTGYSKACINWSFNSNIQVHTMNRFACGTQKNVQMERVDDNGVIVLWENMDYNTTVKSDSGIYMLDISNVNQSVYFQMNAQSNQRSGNSTSIMYHCFLVKDDDWQTLANLAGLEVSSINHLLANSDTLLANKEAVNFMVKQCTGTFMTSAVSNDTFLNSLNSSEYKSIIYANEHWAKFLNMVA